MKHGNIRGTDHLPTEPATPPSGPSGVGGLGANQIARRTLDAQERAAKALEDIRDMARAALESLAPFMVQIVEGLGSAIGEAAEEMRELQDKLAAVAENSTLDTHEG